MIMREIKSILFVCLGNTARSPVAEYLAKFYAKRYGLDLIIESAGFINAFSTMQPESHEYLSQKNISYSDFSPQIISRSLINKFDLILTMEMRHRDEIIEIYKEVDNVREKTFTLKEFNHSKGNLDIIDPYYSSYNKFKEILKIIDQEVETAILNIKSLRPIKN